MAPGPGGAVSCHSERIVGRHWLVSQWVCLKRELPSPFKAQGCCCVRHPALIFSPEAPECL